MKNWERALLLEKSTIKQAIVNLKKTGLQIVLVVNKKKELKGILTDGDLRNIILKKKQLNEKIDKFINKKPFILKQETNHKVIEDLMIKKKILQIPLVKKKRVTGLYVWSQLCEEKIKENIFLIMAGGVGKRMIPYSYNLPKPMLKVDNKPIIEHIILQAKKFGFNKFYISINYLGEKIVKFLGNGSKYKVKIVYIKEKKPLGTAGCLHYLRNRTSRPILVSNGDIVSDVNFSDLLNYHLNNKAELTVAARIHEIENPFGVIYSRNNLINKIIEKPKIRSSINMGLYVINPKITKFVEKNSYTDMHHLIEKLLKNKAKVISYTVTNKWHDIGRPSDLKYINKNYERIFK